MIIQASILLIGLILLYFGSSLLVDGAAGTAALYAVRPVIIGLTVVSFATSAPELLVSLVAAVKGSGGISLGNIMGSNVINITLVLGLSAMIHPVRIQKQIAMIDIPYMLAVSILFWIMCMDGMLERIDGVILLFLLAVFLAYGLKTAKEKTNGEDPPGRTGSQIIKYGIFIIIGIGMLAVGANFVVKNAVYIAREVGLSEIFIGISIVALGTSLPELATSAVASARGQSDISVGNVVGSNLFNICLVMGVVGVFNPMPVDGGLHHFQFPFMLFICAMLLVLGIARQMAGKTSGMIFVVLFACYIVGSYLK